MADTTKTGKSEGEQQRGTSLARQPEGRSAWRRDPLFGPYGGPFDMMERMAEEMDRLFDRFTGESAVPRRSRLSRLFGSQAREGMWVPRVDVVQKEDRFIVRADLPGLKKDEIEVDLTDDAITIRGERQQEQREEREGYWRTEREYGQFHRTIALPEGVIADSAQATFRDGVLEITMQAAPAAANRGRKLEIRETAEQKR